MTVSRPLPRSRDNLGAFIGGTWESGSGSGATDVVDCGTGDVLGTVTRASVADADRAVDAARKAFPAWSALSPGDRAAWLRVWHAELAARSSELTALITAEVGTAVRLSGPVQVGSALGVLASTADLLEGMDFEEHIGRSLVVREPVGVVAALTPWNFPLFQSMGKVAAALAAGCTVVHKPSLIAPLSAIVLAEAAEKAGLPAGVYNLVVGDGPDVGEALARHPGVHFLSFTGSTAVGARVYQLAAGTLKRVALELGGKSASVLLDDAPLEAAVRTSVNRAFLNSGQTCDAWTRLIVPRTRLQDAVDLAVESTRRLTVGDPFDERTRIGPVISEGQAERVRAYITEAVGDGASLAAGGAALPDGCSAGNYVRPTILTDVRTEMRVAREEVFGPVLAVMAYDTEGDAVDQANATDYGLSAAVWSVDEDHALRVARRLEAGQVVVNGGPFDPRVPFGGIKRSGIGRELGRYGIEEFLVPKAFVRSVQAGKE
jgi:aldehyde dehydrogenase (NAD+)